MTYPCVFFVCPCSLQVTQPFPESDGIPSESYRTKLMQTLATAFGDRVIAMRALPYYVHNWPVDAVRSLTPGGDH